MAVAAPATLPPVARRLPQAVQAAARLGVTSRAFGARCRQLPPALERVNSRLQRAPGARGTGAVAVPRARAGVGPAPVPRARAVVSPRWQVVSLFRRQCPLRRPPGPAGGAATVHARVRVRVRVPAQAPADITVAGREASSSGRRVSGRPGGAGSNNVQAQPPLPDQRRRPPPERLPRLRTPARRLRPASAVPLQLRARQRAQALRKTRRPLSLRCSKRFSRATDPGRTPVWRAFKTTSPRAAWTPILPILKRRHRRASRRPVPAAVPVCVSAQRLAVVRSGSLPSRRQRRVLGRRSQEGSQDPQRKLKRRARRQRLKRRHSRRPD